MNAKALYAFIGLVLMAVAAPVVAQGFADLQADSEGFANVTPGTQLSFPADHGAHPNYRIEWWYLTANIKGDDGKHYGVQWTLFRSNVRPQDQLGQASTRVKEPWSSSQVWMGHAAVTSATSHHVSERFARGDIGQAGVTVTPFEAWIDDWHIKTLPSCDGDPLACIDVRASSPDFSYHLKLRADRPLVLHGDNGYSVKSMTGQASYYYSQPFYRVAGKLQLPTGPVTVTGDAWLDREWSSQLLGRDQTGWDWLSLHFSTGEKLMGFRLRDGSGGFLSATWIDRDGKSWPQPPGALRLTPLATAQVAGREIPVRWRVELPVKGIDLQTEPLNEQAWMTTRFPYWEGPIVFRGSHTGRGYLEMTGYPPRD